MARTSTMLLLTGDYADRLDALYAAAQAAAREDEKSPSPRRLNELTESAALRKEYEDLRAEAEKDAVKVVLHAIGRREWRDLKAKHPPRVEGVSEDIQRADRLAGVNVDTVEDDLVHASLVEPSFSSRAAFDEWVNDEISEGDFQAILQRAWMLVNVARVDPKSLAPSQAQTSGQS